MTLITEEIRKIYNKNFITAGSLVVARHISWKEAKCGIITSVTEKEITIQCLSSIGNGTNYLTIPVEEVDGKKWMLRWSKDLKEVMAEGE